MRGFAKGRRLTAQTRAAPLRSQIPRDIPHPAAPATYSTPLPITAMAFTADGKQLLVGGYHELLVWDPATGQLTARVGNIPQRTFGMAFSPDDSWLAVAGGSPGVSGEVRLIPWRRRAQGGEPPKVLATRDDVFFDVAFRPDGKQLAAGGPMVRFACSTCHRRRATQDQQSRRLGDRRLLTAPTARIATASRDKTAKVFDAETGRLLASYSEHAAPVRGVAFAPDGKSVISVGGNGARVWKVEDSTTIGELPPFQGETQAIVAHRRECLRGVGRSQRP